MSKFTGARRERITIYSLTETADAHGQPLKTWPALRTVWAQVASFVRGSQEIAAMNEVKSVSIKIFTMNYRSDVTEKMRIGWRSVYWNIHYIDVAADKFTMDLHASRVV